MICKSMFYFIHNFFLRIIIFVVFCYQLTQKIGRLENDHYDKLLFYMVLITSLESLSQLFGTQVNLPEEIIQQLPLPELSYGENYLP